MYQDNYSRIIGIESLRTVYAVSAKNDVGVYAPITFNVFEDAMTLFKQNSDSLLSKEERYTDFLAYYDFDATNQCWRLYSLYPISRGVNYDH